MMMKRKRILMSRIQGTMVRKTRKMKTMKMESQEQDPPEGCVTEKPRTRNNFLLHTVYFLVSLCRCMCFLIV